MSPSMRCVCSAKIEAAAGLTPGAGGVYHHFASKEAVLAAGIERQLSRLGALREIRQVLGSLGDLKAELTLTARYVLAELDSETELLRILASDARNRPQLLTTTAEQLVSSTFTGFCHVDQRTRQARDHGRQAGAGLRCATVDSDAPRAI
jgi:AcrR family transcriptional regulator